MAIYHLSAKVIGRTAGRSAVAAAAYRAGAELYDERREQVQDFTRKSDVVWSAILAPKGTPARWQDRETLWNEVERIEKRKDAVLAREVEVAIPREFGKKDGIDLVRRFAEAQFVRRGMVADINVHWDRAKDGSPKPHAHIMLSLREAGVEGFGKKVRDWNDVRLLRDWRVAWAELVNTRMAELGLDVRVDHRSYRDQGVELEPQGKIGPVGLRHGVVRPEMERVQDHEAIARRNGERILEDPRLGLEALTRNASTFTPDDLKRFAFRHSADREQFARVLARLQTSADLVELGRDGRGELRLTTREMVLTEAQMVRSAEALSTARTHLVRHETRQAAGEGRVLSSEQRDALDHLTGSSRMAAVIGYAGSGKSTLLGAAAEVWRGAGYEVCGAALSGVAAETLEAGSGITSRTIASLEHGWSKGRDALGPRHVLVLDEAGMVGSRQLARVVEHVHAAGAKLVLIGDTEQLQAIEAGAAFRAVIERIGAPEMTGIHRQREDWQREAVREMARGRTGAALQAFERRGHVLEHIDAEAASRALIAAWSRDRAAAPGASQLVLAPTRADVTELNGLARQVLRRGGELGPERSVMTDRGERAFATGDRLMFLRNERSLEVKNGTIGEVVGFEGDGSGKARLRIRLQGQEGREVAFSTRDYAAFDHGYAATVHKAQGVTVDRVYVLAGPSMDRHMTYVALSRQREHAELHWSQDRFRSSGAMTLALSRERAKDTTLDYPERRDIEPTASFRGRVAEFVSAMALSVSKSLGFGRSRQDEGISR